MPRGHAREDGQEKHLQGHIGGKTLPHGVFRYAARIGKMQKIARPPGFGTDTAHTKPTEWLALYHGPGRPLIEIKIAHSKALFGHGKSSGTRFRARDTNVSRLP